jgi:hypothetical protein
MAFKSPASPFDGNKKLKSDSAESEPEATQKPKVVVQVQSGPNGPVISIVTPVNAKLNVLQALAWPTPPHLVQGK